MALSRSYNTFSVPDKWFPSLKRNIKLTECSDIVDSKCVFADDLGKTKAGETVAMPVVLSFYTQHLKLASFPAEPILRAKHYEVRLPAFKADRVDPRQLGQIYLRIGLNDKVGAGKGSDTLPVTDPAKNNQLCCLALKLDVDPATGLLLVDPDHEKVQLSAIRLVTSRTPKKTKKNPNPEESTGAPIQFNRIWGVTQLAFYWIQVVLADDQEHAQALTFRDSRVVFSMVIQHHRGREEAKSTRKRKIATKASVIESQSDSDDAVLDALDTLQSDAKISRKQPEDSVISPAGSTDNVTAAV